MKIKNKKKKLGKNTMKTRTPNPDQRTQKHKSKHRIFFPNP